MDQGVKAAVGQYWDESPCGDVYATGADLRAQLESQAAARYSLEPYIEPFARFDEAAGEDVLEVGVGMGADHARLAQAQPGYLAGIDLTSKAVEWTGEHLSAYGLSSDLRVADAENLPFGDASFSLVYSWGVLHHTPDTQGAIDELCRVLKPGGRARVMMYNRRSVVGYVLWTRHALLSGRPFRTLDDIYSQHLESPGTKAYHSEEVLALFSGFSVVSVQPQLSFADLMQGAAGTGHSRRLIKVARTVWPRRIIQRRLPDHGLYLLVEARK